MRIGRTIPPAASPIYIGDIINGFKGLIRGKQEIERFRSELKEYFNVKHCFLVSSGKAALTLTLRALNKMYPEREEVLIPAFACYSVPSAIVCAGLKIKLCDINPDMLDIDYDQLIELIAQSSPVKSAALVSKKHLTGHAKLKAQSNSKSKLLAIVPIHLFGFSSDTERIRELVDDPEIAIIEDAAQVMGSNKSGKKLGTLGDVGFFSLGRGKALSATEGGIILSDNDIIAENIKLQLTEISEYNWLQMIKLIFSAIMLWIFMQPSLFWFPKLLPFLKLGDTIFNPEFKILRMSAFQAGITRGWKKKLARFIKTRKENSKYWAQMAAFQGLKNYECRNGETNGFLRFPIRVEDSVKRDAILEQSHKKGMGIMLTYPGAINSIDELKKTFKNNKYPVAERLADQLITLPTHPYVSGKELSKIDDLFASIFSSNK